MAAHVKKIQEFVTSPFVMVDFSAGDGHLGTHFDKDSYIGFDIEPRDTNITKLDWLETNTSLDQTLGDRLQNKVRVLGYNPPFGRGGSMVTKFLTCQRTLNVVDPDWVILIAPVRSVWPEIMKHFKVVYQE